MTKKTDDKQSKPKVPLGKPLELSDEDLDRLSVVTDDDIDVLKRELEKNLGKPRAKKSPKSKGKKQLEE